MSRLCSLSARSPFLITFVLGVCSWSAVLRGQSRVVTPPYDVQAERQRYYEELAKVRDQCLKDYPLRYDEEGNVIRDAAHEAATARYREAKRRAAESLRGDRKRDAEFRSLCESSGATDGLIERGTSPTDAAYGGAFSDRDVEVKSSKSLNDIMKMARQKGYTVEHGSGYVRIKELDVVVWNSGKYNPRDASGRLERMHDVEVVLNPDEPSVSQQIKKAEHDLRRPIPDSHREQTEMVTNLGKAGDKSGKSVASAGGEPVVSPDMKRRLADLKSRKTDVDDIADPFDKREARVRKIEDFRQSTEVVLRDSLRAERQARLATAERLKGEIRDLHGKAQAAGTAAERQRLNREIKQRDQQLEHLHRRQQADDLTLRVVEKKNPRARRQIIRPDEVEDIHTAHTPKGKKLTILKAYGLSIVGKGLGIWQAFEQEWDASTRQERRFSQARMAGNMLLNASGVTQVISSIENADYATGDGIGDFMDAEADRLAREGFDIGSNPGLRNTVMNRAILRGTATATWETLKAIPFVGDVVGGVEDGYLLLEGIHGTRRDLNQSAVTLRDNLKTQTEQHERALANARAGRDELRRMIQAAETSLRSAEHISAMRGQIATLVEQFEGQLSSLAQGLATVAESAKTDATPVDGKNFDRAVELEPYLRSVTLMARAFIRDADDLLHRARVGELSQEDLQGILRERITPQFKAIDADANDVLARLGAASDEAARRQASGDAAVLRMQLSNRLDSAQPLLETLHSLVSAMENLDYDFQALRSTFDNRQKALRDAIVRWNTIAAESERPELQAIQREIIHLRLPELAISRYASVSSELRSTRQRLELRLTQTAAAIPAAPDAERIGSYEPEDSGTWARVLNVAEETRAAVEEARDRYQQLLAVAPIEPPTLTLKLVSLQDQTAQLELVTRNLPKRPSYMYSWDFGDGAVNAQEELRVSHTYRRAGTYTVNVTVWERRPDVTAKIGEASLAVNVVGPTGTPDSKDSPGTQVPGELLTGVSLDFPDSVQTFNPKGIETGDIIFRKLRPGEVQKSATLHFRYNPSSGLIHGELTGNMQLGVSADGSLPGWWLEYSGVGQGRANQDTGTFAFSIERMTWKESYHEWLYPPKYPGDQGAERYSAEARAQAQAFVARSGYDPRQMNWIAVVRGRIGFRDYSGGEGSLEGNPAIASTWKLQATNGWGVVLPPSLYRIAGRNLFPRAVLFQSEEVSKSSRGMVSPSPTPPELARIADSAYGHPRSGVSFRFGRWQIAVRGPMIGIPDAAYATWAKDVRAFIEDSDLEELVPPSP